MVQLHKKRKNCAYKLCLKPLLNSNTSSVMHKTHLNQLTSRCCPLSSAISAEAPESTAKKQNAKSKRDTQMFACLTCFLMFLYFYYCCAISCLTHFKDTIVALPNPTPETQSVEINTSLFSLIPVVYHNVQLPTFGLLRQLMWLFFYCTPAWQIVLL